MFGIGFPELIIIGIIALLVFGPNKLPELAKALGKGLNEFKKATQEMKENLEIDDNIKEDLKGIKNNLDSSLKEIKEDISDSMTQFNKALNEELAAPQDKDKEAAGTPADTEGSQKTDSSPVIEPSGDQTSAGETGTWPAHESSTAAETAKAEESFTPAESPKEIEPTTEKEPVTAEKKENTADEVR